MNYGVRYAKYIWKKSNNLNINNLIYAHVNNIIVVFLIYIGYNRIVTNVHVNISNKTKIKVGRYYEKVYG